MRRFKIVVISRCADCPVELCEDRVVCGDIPQGCALEEAPLELDQWQCQHCRAHFRQIPLVTPYCPVCGSKDLNKLIKG